MCETHAAGFHAHHVQPQARGGRAGPTVDLCGTCHTSLHAVERRMRRGQPYGEYAAHLNAEALGRLEALARVAAAAMQGDTPGRTLLSFEVEDEAYLPALDAWRADRGFTSRAQALNAMLRAVAEAYGKASTVRGGGALPPRRLSHFHQK